jgi:flagellar biosynthesis/type III secretory pathway chaperone
MTTASPDTARVALRLQALFEQLEQRIDDYLDFLQQVHAAIRDNDASRLEQLLPHDQALQQAVDEPVRQRDLLLEALGVDSLGTLLGQLGNPAPLMQARERIEQQLEQLRRQLMSNDLLLRKSRERLRQSIGILAGHFDSPRASAYSKDGALASAHQQRSLARA